MAADIASELHPLLADTRLAELSSPITVASSGISEIGLKIHTDCNIGKINAQESEIYTQLLEFNISLQNKSSQLNFKL